MGDLLRIWENMEKIHSFEPPYTWELHLLTPQRLKLQILPPPHFIISSTVWYFHSQSERLNTHALGSIHPRYLVQSMHSLHLHLLFPYLPSISSPNPELVTHPRDLVQLLPKVHPRYRLQRRELTDLPDQRVDRDQVREDVVDHAGLEKRLLLV